MRRTWGVLAAVVWISSGFLTVATPAAAQVPSDIATGSSPASLALDPARGQLFVDNSSAHDVGIINLHTNTLTSTLPVSGPVAVDTTTGMAFVAAVPLYAISEATDTIAWTAPTTTPGNVVVDPTRGLVFVSNSDQTVSVYSEQSERLVGQINLGLTATSMAVDGRLGRLFAASGTTLAVVDLSTYGVSYWTENNPIFSLAVDQTAGYLYAGNYMSTPFPGIYAGNLVVLDASTGSQVPGTSTLIPISPPPSPWSIAVDSSDGTAFVLRGDNHVQAVHAGSTTVSYTFTLPSTAGGIAVDPSDDLAYVADSGTGAVSVLDTADDAVTTQVAANNTSGPGLGTALAVNPTSSTLYTAGPGAVWALDASTLQTHKEIPVSGSVVSLAVDSGLNRVFATTENGLVAIDGPTGLVLTTVPTGGSAAGVAVDQSSHKVYVTNTDAGTVTVVDGTTDTTEATVPVGNYPEALAVDSVHHKVVVADSLGVQIIDGVTDSVSAAIPFSASAVVVDDHQGAAFAIGRNGTARIDILSATITKQVRLGSYVQSGFGSNGAAINATRHDIYPAMLDESLGQHDTVNTASSTISSAGLSAVAVDPELDTWYEATSPGGSLTEFSSGPLPAAPTIVASGAGNRAIGVVWSAPSDVGASPIASYAVAAAPRNGSPASIVTVGASQQEAVITGLRNDTNYQVTVTASNSYGAGDPSTPVILTPQGPPAPTTMVVSGTSLVDYGKQEVITASVSPVPDGGTMAFYSDGAAITGCGARPLSTSTGLASCTFTPAAGGTLVTQAVYSGDPDFGPAAGATHQTVISPPCPTETTHQAGGTPVGVTSTLRMVNGAECPGYWIVTSAGGVTSVGSAPWLGDVAGLPIGSPTVDMAATADGSGYWLLTANGEVFSFHTGFYGSAGDLHLKAPMVSITMTPSGRGYWLTAADGGVFAYGDANFEGSTGAIQLARPIIGMAMDRATGGYWLYASDGGIFSFHARFDGSTGGIRLARPIVGMSPTLNDAGYRLVASDGGVFDFGRAAFYGSLAGRPGVALPVTTMTTSLAGSGYYLIDAKSQIWGFGQVPHLGGG